MGKQLPRGGGGGSLLSYVEARQANARTDRWERIEKAIRGEDGGMELEEAERILANRKRMRLFLEHMDEVVAAIKCVAALESAGAQQAEAETGAETEALEPRRAAQDVDTTSLRVYLHGPLPAASNAEYRINEDDYWESELIVHFISNQVAPLISQSLCVNTDTWGGPDHWHNGPITLPGFDLFADLETGIPTTHDLYGRWQCTGDVRNSPYVTVLQTLDDDGSNEFVYRARIRTRDNNVVEDDFSIADDLVFRFWSVSSGKLKFRPETVEEPDRAAWKLKRDTVAWPDRGARSCLGDGQKVWIYNRNQLTCGFVANKRWRARFTNSGGTFCGGREARADLSADAWLPDHCYPVNNVPKIPPTPANTNAHLDNTELPIIEEDDVSWIKLHKRDGKWTVSLSKPVMVTDGTRIVGGEPFLDNINSAHGLTLTMSGIPGNTSSYKQVHLLIPAENGIVLDKDYPLADLKRIGNLAGWHPPEGSESFGESCQSTEKARTEMRNNMNFRLPGGFHGKYALSSTKINTFVRNNTLSSRTGDKKGLEMDLPPNGSDLCADE